MNKGEPGRPILRALLVYTALSLLMTWPLILGVTRDVPGDLGDSLLNMWILGWGAEHVPRLAVGQVSIADYWNANIFHPEPLALGFSEHLFGEVLQILPVYWITGNLILSYNLLFLSSFVLSGLGMFLLVRDLLGDTARSFWPALVAGIIFAFVPFRIAQVAHIQSLQAQWMPLALFAFRRFVLTGRVHPLAGGTAALLMQNWTNGYYLIFFAPIVPLFVVHQMWAHDRLRQIRLWGGFAIAAIVVAAGTWPFLALYLETQRVYAFQRPLGEVIRYSADVYSYLTAPEALNWWGTRMQAYPKPEGELFFGIVPWVLAIIGLIATVAGTPATPGRAARWRNIAGVLLTVVIAVQAAGLMAMVFTGGFVTSVAGIPLRATNPARIAYGIALASVVLLIVSRDARERVLRFAQSSVGLLSALTILALWLSLGPAPQAHGRPLQGFGLYGVLYDHVPGFEGLRVPARYAMIAAVFLSAAAGFGVAALMRLRTGAVAAVAVALLFLCEASFLPMTLNATWGDGAIMPPARIEPADDAPPVYHTLAALSDSTVVAEFPFGDPAWELRYVYYSTVHWKRLVNGYSGGFPQAYRARVALLQRIQGNPDAAWRALRDAGTTHVVVHEQAFLPGGAEEITRWLDDHFAVEIARFEGSRLYDVSGVWPPK